MDGNKVATSLKMAVAAASCPIQFSPDFLESEIQGFHRPRPGGNGWGLRRPVVNQKISPLSLGVLDMRHPHLGVMSHAFPGGRAIHIGSYRPLPLKPNLESDVCCQQILLLAPVRARVDVRVHACAGLRVCRCPGVPVYGIVRVSCACVFAW